MRKKQILFIAEVSIFAALGLVIDFFCGLYCKPVWLNGGSVTLAYIPIFIMAYRHGLKGGLITGLLVGTIQLLWSAYMLNFWQVLLDYILPNLVLGLVGIVSTKVNASKGFKQILYISIPILIVCFIRLVSLTLSGIWFWETGFWASVVYNGSYTGISTLICLILTVPLVKLVNKINF